ncbi:MAG: YfiR family protein [Caulobacteraceae bacterium]|nr:YfiR family protein [Caulobacteraceae bacterium]
MLALDRKFRSAPEVMAAAEGRPFRHNAGTGGLFILSGAPLQNYVRFSENPVLPGPRRCFSCLSYIIMFNDIYGASSSRLDSILIWSGKVECVIAPVMLKLEEWPRGSASAADCGSLATTQGHCGRRLLHDFSVVLGLVGRALPRWRLSMLYLLAGVGVAGAGHAQDGLDLATKASYLYRFAAFVDWPAGAFPTPTSPFELCVVGYDPFGPVLDRAVDGQFVDGHPVALRRQAVVDPAAGCQMAFVAGSAAEPVKDGLAKLAGTPVLTVTDNSATPGVVDFVPGDGRVRFRIDDQAAADHGLVISSKLESLAVSVNPRKPIPTP